MGAFCLILLAVTAAVAPTAVIVAPQRANPGDLVVLDATQSRDADGFAWVLADSDKTLLEVEQGRKAVFASGTPGRYTFVLVAASAEKDGKPLVAVARHVLTIGDPQPGPDPQPPTPPEPEPLPVGKYGLARLARDRAGEVDQPATQRRASAAALAGSFESIAGAIAAGALRAPTEILAATRAGNVSALGAARPHWEPWAEALRVKLNELADDGQLVQPEEYTIAWREIATGLRAVK